MLQKIVQMLSDIWNPVNAWGEVDGDKLMLALIRVLLLSVAVSVLSLVVKILT